MNAFLRVLILCASTIPLAAQPSETGQGKPAEIMHVATALDHLTVLEYGEPVVMVATGSNAFQIERHENKVFIKPLKAGVATDLFVWTASTRFNYELEEAGEVKNMNFAIESKTPPKPTDDSGRQMAQAADLLLTHSLLASEQVDSSSLKTRKNGITVRIERVLRTKNALYIHYRVQNQGKDPYRVLTPSVCALNASNSAISLRSLQDVQLNDRLIARLGKTEQSVVDVAHAEVRNQDVSPGSETEGVVVLRQELPSPTVLELRFGSVGTEPIRATVIL
jgi:hypothetical protein